MVFVRLKQKVSQTCYHTVGNGTRKLAFRSPHNKQSPNTAAVLRTDKAGDGT